jgi:Zn-dependent metalloprotease
MTTYSQKTKKSHKIRFTQIDKKQEKDSPLSLLSSKLKPGSGVEFKQVKSKTDKKNFKHTIYQQYYRGIKIEHGQVKFHEKNGLLKSYSGAYYEPNSLNTSPRVQKSRAISIAERFMGGNKVFWLDEEGISKTNTPKTELVILPNRKNETLQLAYKIGLGTSQGELKMGFLYIDAQTGAVLKFKNQVFFCFEDEKKNYRRLYK